MAGMLLGAAWIAHGGVFTQVGVHPYASRQPTTAGMSLRVMEAWNGQIYAGYGDYSANTGPIDIAPFDPQTYTFSNAMVADSDALLNMRPFLGYLYFPHTDSISQFHWTRVDAQGQWYTSDQPYTTHAYDMLTFDGSDIWLAGSSSYDAVAWRSQDGGLSFPQAQKQNYGAGYVNRYYGIASYNGSIYIQNNYGTTSRVFNGTAWADGPHLGASIYSPRSFAGKMAYRSSENGYSSYLKCFDGALVTTNAGSHYNNTVYGDKLFLLATGGYVLVTRDLASWDFVAQATNTARCLAVWDGRLFVGTSDSKIFEFSDPVSPLPMLTVVATNRVACKEGLKPGQFVLTRTGPTVGALTAHYTVRGSGVNGGDYALLSGTALIPSGTNAVVVNVQPLAGMVTTSNRYVWLTLNNDAAYDAGQPNDARVMLMAVPEVTVQALDSQIPDTGAVGRFLISRAGPTGTALTVKFTLAGAATNGSDYRSSVTGSVSMAAGATAAEVRIAPKAATNCGPDLTVKLTVTANAGYVPILPQAAIMTILNAQVPGAPNGILNPSFETRTAPTGPPDNWSGGIWDNQIAHSGQSSLRIETPTTYGYTWQKPGLAPGKTYLISLWVKASNSCGLGGSFRMVPAGFNVVNATAWVGGDSDWTRVSMLYATPTNYTDSRFDLAYRTNPGDTIWFDDVNISETSPVLQASVSNLTVNAGGFAVLTFLGTSGRTYAVQTSTNLITGRWTNFITGSAGAQPIVVTDTNSASRRFYRVRMQ